MRSSPGPQTSRRGWRYPHMRGFEAAVNTESSFSRTSVLTSGGASGGGGSGALSRMNSGTGERLSARPQPASASAPPAINAM